MSLRLLDLFCGAGGTAVGYHRAGFTEIVGVDNRPQPRFPFQFVQADALEYVAEHGREFDAIHASPPCQRYSRMTTCRTGLQNTHPDLVAATRRALRASGKEWVIENVVGAPLATAVMLCGTMFGLSTYRHRLFESSVCLLVPPDPHHEIPASKAGHWIPGTMISVAGNCAPIALARAAMEVDWTTRAELAEAIPPAYTEFIGKQLREAVAR